jgi:tetratricopeptide (TPR) repeat protein
MSPQASFQFIAYAIMLLVVVGLTTYGNLRLRRKRRAIDALMAPYRKGDYAAALQAVECLRSYPRDYCFFRGAILVQLGDLKEAEPLLLQSIALSEQPERALLDTTFGRSIKLTALSRSELGELYLEQSRYDDALRCFEASLRDWPRRGATHRAIAETLLRRGDDPAGALKWARLAVEEDRASRTSTQEVRETNLGEDLGTLAWAVAVASHDGAEVDRLVSEALSVVGTHLVTSSARVEYHSGLAFAALGDTARRARHLENAARIDSRGRWGRAARAAAHR